MTDIAPPLPANGPPEPDGRNYLLRSEEQLQVGTERVITGYARLEKFVVTETQTITVEVSHEEFRLVHEPAEVPAAPRQPDQLGQKNTARWLQAHREEIVVTTRLIPTERARLEVYPVTEQRQVTDEVRKEQFDLTGAADNPAAPNPALTGTDRPDAAPETKKIR